MEEKFRFDDGAQKDIKEAFESHELQNAGRGDKFLESFKFKLKQIEKKPKAISADKNGVRKRSLKGYPYFIFYTIASPFILIIAVWHFSRDRFGWKKRIKKD